MMFDSQTVDVSRCHGCGLCSMVCPLYHQGGNVMMTPHGLAKSSQHSDELQRDNVFACMLCGACAPYCPQDIDLMQMLVNMRSGYADEQPLMALSHRPASQKAKPVLIADDDLRQDSERLQRILERLGKRVIMASDQGDDISRAMYEGKPVSHQRLQQFLTTLQPVKQIIVSDGLLQTLIRSRLPQIPMQSLGSLLSSHSDIRKQIGAGDLYVMDSRSYHASYDDMLSYYDSLQQQTGCQLNRDLHRVAIPTGVHASNGFDKAAQVQWLLKGRKFDRVIAESLADYHILASHCEHPVVHVAELLT